MTQRPGVADVRAALGGSVRWLRRLPRGGVNAVYHGVERATRQDVVVRVLTRGDEAAAAGEVRLHDYLHGRGVRCPRTVALPGCGAVVGVASTVSGRVHGALVLSFVRGRMPANDEDYAAVGATLARLHAVPVPADLGACAFDAAQVRERVARAGVDELGAPLDDVVDSVVGACEDAGRAICHGDLLPANFVVGRGDAYLLDFESMGVGYRLLDLGSAVFGAVATVEPAGAAARVSGLLAAYERGGHLSPAARRSVYGAAAVAGMKVAAWRLDAGAGLDWRAPLRIARWCLDRQAVAAC